jgi:hypothetical protein
MSNPIGRTAPNHIIILEEIIFSHGFSCRLKMISWYFLAKIKLNLCLTGAEDEAPGSFCPSQEAAGGEARLAFGRG